MYNKEQIRQYIALSMVGWTDVIKRRCFEAMTYDDISHQALNS
jgi:hypothetical protein